MPRRFPNCLLAVPLFLAGASPLGAAQPYDGSWTLTTATRVGTCNPYTLDVGISDGRIQTPAGVLVSGAGSVSPSGHVSVKFVAGSNVISASGRAFKATASGRWNAPTLACSGKWSAQRK